MQKATVLLLVVGGILGFGIILSFYGNQILFEGLTRGEGSIRTGEDLVITSEIDRSDSQNGIYAVQMAEYKDGVLVQILDPFDVVIESEQIDGDLFEGRFKVDHDGTYKMVVKNNGSDQVGIFGVMGPEPEAGAKSLGFISMYVLVIGLLGMAGVGIFALKKRRH